VCERSLRSARALDDGGLDAGNDFARRVEAGVCDFIEDGGVTLVSDGGQHRDLQLADEARELVVVEPSEIVDSPTAADEDKGVGWA
jgi:hypothetical protein